MSGRAALPLRDDRGAVTAEFALVVSAVAVVLGLCLAAVGAVGQSVRLQDAAGLAARAVGRGDDVLAATVRSRLAPTSTMQVSRGELVCVRLDDHARLGPVPGGVSLSAESCAPERGE